MNCPICNFTLLTTKRLGIEIDYCPHWCGIWLDRGEFDELAQKFSMDVEHWYELLSLDRAQGFTPKREKYPSWRLNHYWHIKNHPNRRIADAH